MGWRIRVKEMGKCFGLDFGLWNDHWCYFRLKTHEDMKKENFDNYTSNRNVRNITHDVIVYHHYVDWSPDLWILYQSICLHHTKIYRGSPPCIVVWHTISTLRFYFSSWINNSFYNGWDTSWRLRYTRTWINRDVEVSVFYVPAELQLFVLVGLVFIYTWCIKFSINEGEYDEARKVVQKVYKYNNENNSHLNISPIKKNYR